MIYAAYVGWPGPASLKRRRRGRNSAYWGSRGRWKCGVGADSREQEYHSISKQSDKIDKQVVENVIKEN